MGLRDKSGSNSIINLINAALRAAQVILAASIIGIYVTYLNDYRKDGLDIHSRMSLGIANAVLSILTALLFGTIPLLISYYYIAIAFIWDWIIFFIWCAVFGTIHSTFKNDATNAMHKKNGARGVDEMAATQWVDLALMLLFLTSGVMGPMCLCADRKSLFASRAVV